MVTSGLLTFDPNLAIILSRRREPHFGFVMELLDLESLLRVPYVDPDYGFSLSPDGRQVAFAYNLSGQWEIYLQSLERLSPLQKITAGPGAKFAPRWSPDGQRLAYVQDLEGGELFDIWVYDLAAGQHLNLTPDTPDSIQPNYAWSPDGTQLAFISDRSGRFDTYVMPVAGGPARRVLSVPRPDWEVRWSPDGQWLSVVVEASGQDYATYLVPSAGGEVKPIGQKGTWLPAKDAVWSPGSSRLAFSSNVREFFEIGVYDTLTGQITWPTDGAGDKEQPAWSPDGRRLAYVVGEGPVSSLAVLDLNSLQVRGYQVAPGVHYRPRFTPDGKHLVLVFDNPVRPDDLWLLSLHDGSCRQLTESLPPHLADQRFTIPEMVHYPSLDGTSVPALLYRPEPTGELPPAVLYIHGGPNWLTQVTWSPLVQHMVSRGWVVLAPNYRGSTGYGREWQLANRFDLGGGDTQDVVAGADHVICQELAHPGRIAVTGRSYGGYLTMTSLTQYPDRWAGGSAVVPFLNWFTGHANSREDLQHWDLENFGHPEKDRELYYERSPFFFLDRVAAPVQLICGAHDPRCPASESLQAHDVLQAQGKPCELVLYPNEGHSFYRTENVVDAQKRQVAFLARALE
jgi:dipeptidyl aminopeptidase/acylaminoacyl peptidase